MLWRWNGLGKDIWFGEMASSVSALGQKINQGCLRIQRMQHRPCKIESLQNSYELFWKWPHIRGPCFQRQGHISRTMLTCMIGCRDQCRGCRNQLSAFSAVNSSGLSYVTTGHLEEKEITCLSPYRLHRVKWDQGREGSCTKLRVWSSSFT